MTTLGAELAALLGADAETGAVSADTLVELWRRVMDPAYTDPIEEENDGVGMDLIHAFAAVLSRAGVAVDTTTQALYLKQHTIQTGDPASGNVQAIGNVLLQRSILTGGDIPLRTGDRLVVQAKNPDGVLRNGVELELTSDVTLPGGSAVPLVAPVRAVRPGFNGNVPAGRQVVPAPFGTASVPLSAATPNVAAIDLDLADPGTVISGGFVETIGDASGNGLAATQANAAQRPAYIASDPDFNGQPSMNFDGVDDYLATPAFRFGGGASLITVYGVIKLSATAGEKVIFGAGLGVGHDGRLQIRQRTSGAGLYVYWQSPGGSDTVSYAVTTPGAVVRFAIVLDISDGANAIKAIYINGADATVSFSGGAADDTEADLFAAGVGATQTGGAVWDGKIARLRAFDEAHTLTTVARHDAALAALYSGGPAAEFPIAVMEDTDGNDNLRDFFTADMVGRFVRFVDGINAGLTYRITSFTASDAGLGTPNLVEIEGPGFQPVTTPDVNVEVVDAGALGVSGIVASMAGGRNAELDMLARERGIYRANGEADDDLRLRTCNLADVVAPNAIVRALTAILEPAGFAFNVIEVGSQNFRGLAYDVDPYDHPQAFSRGEFYSGSDDRAAWSRIGFLVILYMTDAEAAANETLIKAVQSQINAIKGGGVPWAIAFEEPWTPALMADVEVWLDAAAGVTVTAGDVTAIVDQSPTPETVNIVGTLPYIESEPGLGGRPCFDGSSFGQYIDLANLDRSKVQFVAAVTYDDSLDPPNRRRLMYSSFDPYIDTRDAGGPEVYIESSWSFSANAPNSTLEQQRRILIANDGVTPSRYNDQDIEVATPQVFAGTGVRLIADGVEQGTKLAEIIIASTVPPPSVIASLEAYFRMKYT